MYGRDVSLLPAPRIRKDSAHAPWISKDTQCCRSSRRLVRPSDRPERHPRIKPHVRANRPGTRVVDLDHVARSSARMPGGGRSGGVETNGRPGFRVRSTPNGRLWFDLDTYPFQRSSSTYTMVLQLEGCSRDPPRGEGIRTDTCPESGCRIRSNRARLPAV